MFRSNYINFYLIIILFFSCSKSNINYCTNKFESKILNIKNNPLKDFDNDGILNKYDKCHDSNSLNIIDKRGCINIDSLDIVRNNNKQNLKYQNFNYACESGVFIIYGQSNAANSCECSEIVISNKTYQFFQGDTYRLNETMIGATGYKCSPWSFLANLLMENKLYDNVVFANSAVGGSSLEKLVSGPNYNYFIENLKNMLIRYGKVDGILFHQGEANHSQVLGFNNYFKDFQKFIEKIYNISPNTKIYLSRATYCKNYSDLDLISLQNLIINSFDNVFAGPNTDKLIDFRVDDCHLSSKGVMEFSKMFFELIKNPLNIVKNG